MGDFVKEVMDGNFEQEVLASDKPVLIDFWAEWCAPCRMLTPTVEAIAEKFKDNAKVYKLNVDDNPMTAQRYGIKGIPTLIVFKDGKEQERIVGATSASTISKMLETFVAVKAA